MNHVVKIHLHFQLGFLNHRVLKHREYFFELAIRKKRYFKENSISLLSFFLLLHHYNVEKNIDVSLFHRLINFEEEFDDRI